jgi:N utilization substance protein B
MQNRSIARELALLSLGQCNERASGPVPADQLLAQALSSLNSQLREGLDRTEQELQQAQQALLDSELVDGEVVRVRDHLRQGLERA